MGFNNKMLSVFEEVISGLVKFVVGCDKLLFGDDVDWDVNDGVCIVLGN